ncbi:MAG TPA: c-type cytochrome [Vicinamibacterales bacterium]|nr:c-type cytochrome [Vicinamibacterales bacterium]
MRRLLKVLVWIVGVVFVLALCATGAARLIAGRKYGRQWTTHEASFPVPFPLSAAELETLRAERLAAGASAADPLADVDLNAAALTRAIARGEHLIKTRVGCAGCHGADLGGKVLINQALIGHWAAPNLTTGSGSVTRTYSAADWDRAVRHGVRHTGQSSSMPSIEFLNLSDHELSDIVAYVRSRPPVDRELKTVRIGPLFSFIVAFGGDSLVAFTIDHQKPHPVEPPVEVASVELGQHIAQVCRGCHGGNLSGGKIAGDPNMPIVANLTPHETGLKGWTETDFLRALREGKRKDGSDLLPQMPWKAYGQMKEVELKALWAYLQTVPAIEKGNR